MDNAKILDRAHDSNIKATRKDWLDAALETLISDGVDQVKVLPLGKKLSVSRSSFYWYFTSRKHLLDILLDYWQNKNTKTLVEHCAKPTSSITEAILNICECWLDDSLFDPRLDFAVREWSRRDRKVRQILDEADNTRVEAMRQVFLRHGYEPVEGFIRARVFYFTQIGYYALDLHEPIADRLSYLSAYVKAATGFDPEPTLIEAFIKAHQRMKAGLW